MNNCNNSLRNLSTIVGPAQKPAAQIDYTDLSRRGSYYGLKSKVLMERLVLMEFIEPDSSLAEDAADVILALLAYDNLTQGIKGDGRLTVGLLRRADGKLVEVDLMVLPRRRAGSHTIHLRLAGVRELLLPGENYSQN